MQTEVGIPQKERNTTSQSIFGIDGIVNAESSFSFDSKSGDVLTNVSKFPKFAEYFQKRLKPTLENMPSRSAPSYSQLWTNDNCESLNHIIKMNADWKSHETPELIYWKRKLHIGRRLSDDIVLKENIGKHLAWIRRK